MEPRRSGRISKLPLRQYSEELEPILISRKTSGKVRKVFKYSSIFKDYDVSCSDIYLAPKLETETKPIVFFITGSSGSGKSTLYKQLFTDIPHNYYNIDLYYEKLIDKQLKEFKIDLLKKIIADRKDDLVEQLARLTIRDDLTIDTIPEDEKLFTSYSFTDEEKKNFIEHIDQFQNKLIQIAAVCAKTDLERFIKEKQTLVIDATGGARFKTLYNQIIKDYSELVMLFIDVPLETALAQNRNRKERVLKDEIIQRNWEEVQKNKEEFKKLFQSTFIEVKQGIHIQRLKEDIKKLTTLSETDRIIPFLNKSDSTILTNLPANVFALPYSFKQEDTINEKALATLQKNKKHDKVVFIWGRFQPPHIGHEQLFVQAKRYYPDADIYIAPSSSCEGATEACPISKNPLNINDKLIILGNMYPENKFLYLYTRQIFEVIAVLKQVYSSIYLLCGNDRVKSYKTMIEKQKEPVTVIGYDNPERFKLKLKDFSKEKTISATLIRKAFYYHQYSILKQTFARGTYEDEEKFKELLAFITPKIGTIDKSLTIDPKLEDNYLNDFKKAANRSK
jgi:predicted kinase